MAKKKKKISFQKIGKEIDKEVKKGCCEKPHQKVSNCGTGGCFYFLGFVGALVYYISTATGFWNGAWGVLKALVWPAFMVFELMKYLGM